MNKKQLTKKLVSLFNSIIDMLESKGDDYSKEEDRFSNFKKTASLMDRYPRDVILTFISTKQIRLIELMNSDKTPNNESIKDTVKDMIGYLSLLYILLENEETE